MGIANRRARANAAVRRRISAVPLRWRLTLVSILVLIPVLAIYGAALYVQVNATLLDTTANGLRTSARPAIVQQLRTNTFRVATPTATGASATPAPVSPAVAAALPGSPAERSLAELARMLTTRTIAARTLDITGATIGDGPALASMGEVSAPLLDASIYREVAATKTERHWRMETPTGPIIVELIPLDLAGQDQPAVGVLQLTTTLRTGDALLAQLRNQLLVGSILALVATVALTLPLVRGVLTPLRRMAAASRAIAAGELDRRVAVPTSGDALADLAVAFNEMVGQLDDALAAQRRFIADASHELKTPLTALGNGVEMLQMGVDRRDAESREKLLRLMGGEIARMGRMVDDLLTLSEFDRDAIGAIVRAPVDLVALAAQVVDETRLLAPDRNVALDTDGSRPVVVRGDADRLRQALLNLCANARAHTPAGGTIRIEARRTGARAELRVADTGEGIPPEALAQVWDRFFRVEPSRERRQGAGGVGLGLAIVRAITEAHDGTVAITSTVGVGTTVTLTFQAAPVNLINRALSGDPPGAAAPSPAARDRSVAPRA